MEKCRKSHSDFAKAVCLVCFRKNKNMRNISPAVASAIQEFAFSDISEPQWSWLPTAICASCHCQLRLLKSNPPRPFEIVDFPSLTPPQSLRLLEASPSMSTTRRAAAAVETAMGEELERRCNCSVCTVGRLNGGEYNTFKVLMAKPRGRPSYLEQV